jgi:hypothetical protein
MHTHHQSSHLAKSPITPVGHRWLDDAQATAKPPMIGTQVVTLAVSINQVPKWSI